MIDHLSNARLPTRVAKNPPDGRCVWGIEATCTALKLYRRARNQSLLGRLWMLFTGRGCYLLDLALVQDSCSVRERTYAGMRAVPLGQIRGSEGRYLDFDGSFMPLRSEDRQRWLNIAAAHLMGGRPAAGGFDPGQRHLFCARWSPLYLCGAGNGPEGH